MPTLTVNEDGSWTYVLDNERVIRGTKDDEIPGAKAPTPPKAKATAKKKAEKS